MNLVSLSALCVWLIAVLATPGYSQYVNISSNIEQAGRNFSCREEIVTYSCNSSGVSSLLISAPSVFLHAFTSSSSIPGAVTFPSTPNIALILRNGMPNYVASAQIQMIDDPNQIQLNVTCSSDVSGSEQMLPLMCESNIVPPSDVNCERLPGGMRSMIVSWTPPESPQFDIDHYIVRTYRDGQTYTATTRDESLLVEVSEETYADVRSVSTCGTVSAAQRCPETVSVLQNTDPEVKVSAAAIIAVTIVLTLIIVILLVISVVALYQLIKLKKSNVQIQVPVQASDSHEIIQKQKNLK